MFAALFVLPLGAKPEAVPEYDVKAAFLYNFCKFVEWPADSFGGPADAVVLGVLDASPFGNALDKLDGRPAGERTVRIRICARPEDVVGCHLVFINTETEALARRFLSAAKGAPVVTVGEQAPFLSMGGMIRFFREGTKVRFAIDNANAREAGVRISSQLLKLASRPKNRRGL